MIEPEINLELENLINREEEWFTLNLDRLSMEGGIDWFDKQNFLEEPKTSGIFQWIQFLVGFATGFFLFFFCLFVLNFKKGSEWKYKEGTLLGFICKMIYITIFFYKRGEILWFL